MIIAYTSKVLLEYVLFANNSANGFTKSVIFLAESDLFLGYRFGNSLFVDNLGSLTVFNSNVTLTGYILLIRNRSPQITVEVNRQGGAITLIQSNAFFNGTCGLKQNCAENGGAIFSTGSKLYISGHVQITDNVATRSGGGIYLSNSEINCQRRSVLVHDNNTATQLGGGIHAISSSIIISSAFIAEYFPTYYKYPETRLYFGNNVAEKGGGLSLESNTRLYILKRETIESDTKYGDSNIVIFSENSADYGGAVFVNDDTNSACASGQIECFFQVVSVDFYSFLSRLISSGQPQNIETRSIYFFKNYASNSGSNLYGGLLDRCAVSRFAEVHNKYREVYKDGGNGITYFGHVSSAEVTSTRTLISSRPVKVCLCTLGNEYNCTDNMGSTKQVKKGETFTVPLVAVDQNDQPVNATVQSSLHFTQSGLAEGQLSRGIGAECTDLMFNIVSSRDYEELTLYASDGPCKDVEPSTRTVGIHFLPCDFCRIGLQISKINCTCECHNDIRQYIVQCNIFSGAFVRQPQGRVWISYINDTNLTGYLIYPNCPLDYCNFLNISIDLNQPNGADAQCAFNRSSLLCGSCQPGLSLSLGSSHCLLCPRDWPVLFLAITIAAILAGIALIALLLALNMTVAVGTLNGLIFYTNVIYANKSILLPFQESNLVTVFISLLNLELEVDICYFSGLDTYTKTWLKLAFPTLMFFLIGVVIVISSYSIRFSKLIGNKDPVATLATLILLSYAKILQVCFESLSIGILKYPDDSSKAVWLPDATVQYLQGKHILLFIAAVLILLVGLIYTALLFSWQWCFYLPRWNIFKLFLSEQRLKLFIETYHAPFTPKCRYWTGLLLIVRAVLYLVAAANVSNDPQLALSAIVFTMICILFLVAFIDIRMYKKISLNILNTFFILNTLLFSVFTWYSLSSTKINQKAVAYSSVLTTFIMLSFIILYHVYTYTKIFSKVKKFNPSRNTNKFKATSVTGARHHLGRLPDGLLKELLDKIAGPPNTDDHDVSLLDQQPAMLMEPTCSVVELPKPGQDPDQPETEEANIRSIPGPGAITRLHEVA